MVPSPVATTMNARPAAQAPEADELTHGPFDSFRQPGVWDKLKAHPDTRPYVTDKGFVDSVEFLRTATTQAETKKFTEDPRIMQAIGALQGWSLTVTPEEMGKAEWLGAMPKRDAVQMPNLERAAVHQTVEAAKDAGNAQFKAGEYADALACWLRAIHLHGEGQPLEAAMRSTLHSNSAAALLKLKRPADALAECEQALAAAPAGADVSKVHFRRAQAHEELTRGVGVSDDAVVREWGEALGAVRDALCAAKAAGSDGGSVRHLSKEVTRVESACSAAQARAAEARLQAAREEESASLRGGGKALPATAGRADAGSVVVREPAPGYVRDIDLSHWSAAWLAAEVVKLRHSSSSCTISVAEMNRASSDVHASVREKRGKRSLFYDVSLVLDFVATSQLVRGRPPATRVPIRPPPPAAAAASPGQLAHVRVGRRRVTAAACPAPRLAGHGRRAAGHLPHVQRGAGHQVLPRRRQGDVVHVRSGDGPQVLRRVRAVG